MGAYLSSPVCEKDTIEDSNNQLAFAASSMQGWRMSQEDAHNAILNFDDNTSSKENFQKLTSISTEKYQTDSSSKSKCLL